MDDLTSTIATRKEKSFIVKTGVGGGSMRRFGFLYRIEAYLKEVAIAFSGGVDSAYLLYEAKKYAKRAKEAGLFTWDKPAYACLTTRIPTGELITKEKLEATHGNGI